MYIHNFSKWHTPKQKKDVIIRDSIKLNQPSVSKESLRNYENIRARMEDTERINALPRMGYKK